MPEERKAYKQGDQSSEKRPEGELIKLICAGERELFQTLIQPYQRSAFAVAYSLLNNSADAEEVVQEAFIEAFRNLAAFRAEAKFSTWLIQITMNLARRRLRAAKTALHHPKDEPLQREADDYIPRDLADWREIPSEALARKELRQAIQRTIQQLPSIYREVLVLRDVQHLSTQDAAEVLRISEDLVKTRLREVGPWAETTSLDTDYHSTKNDCLGYGLPL